MHASCRGGPELAPSDACPVCLAAHLEGIAAHEDTQVRRPRPLLPRSRRPMPPTVPSAARSPTPLRSRAARHAQAQLDRFAAMGAALAAQDGGGVEGVEQDFWISRDWLRCGGRVCVCGWVHV